MSLSRRQFLQKSAAASIAACAAGQSLGTGAEAADDLPIVDTHQHLWDLEKFDLPWLDGAPQVLKRSYGMRDYSEATRGLKVVKAVYMEVDVAPEQQTAEARHLIEICRQEDTPTVGAVISGRPNSKSFKPYILQFRDTPSIQGVRQVLHVPSAPRGLCLEPQFVASMRLLGEMGLSFDLCMRPTELADGAKLIEQAAETRFIVDHCGNADPTAFLPADKQSTRPSHAPDPWRRDIERMARYENAVCKISGIVARAPTGWDAETLAPIINHCLDAFGPDRVVFGGDWPVCLLGASYREWVTALKAVIAQRPLEEQRKLLHDNAVRLYGLA